jgi:hypothetical protein
MVAATIKAIALALSLVAALSLRIHLGEASNLLQVLSTVSNKPKANGSFFSMLIAVCQATGEAVCCVGSRNPKPNDSHGFLTCVFTQALRPDAS